MLDDIDEFVRIGININFDMTRYIRDFRNQNNGRRSYRDDISAWREIRKLAF